MNASRAPKLLPRSTPSRSGRGFVLALLAHCGAAALPLLLSSCTPSITERASRDVARAFADSEFRRVSPYDNRSTVEYVASHPRVREDLKWFSHNLGYSLGYSLGKLIVP
jgi:hypothetical protein